MQNPQQICRDFTKSTTEPQLDSLLGIANGFSGSSIRQLYTTLQISWSWNYSVQILGKNSVFWRYLETFLEQNRRSAFRSK